MSFFCHSLSFFFFIPLLPLFSFFFFFNDTATTEIYTFPTRRSSDLSNLTRETLFHAIAQSIRRVVPFDRMALFLHDARSEEHTSELQSPCNLVCRLLLEKKKKNT